ncbi:hypothetical protein GCM10027346_40350 [Hymenobacter seoulensis]
MTREILTRFAHNQQLLAGLRQRSNSVASKKRLLDILSSTIESLLLLEPLSLNQRFRLVQLKMLQQSIRDQDYILEGDNMWQLVHSSLWQACAITLAHKA